MFKSAVKRVLLKPVKRSYHSIDHPVSNLIYNPKSVESIILTKSFDHVPTLGFNINSITQAVRDMKYSDSLVSAITGNPSGNSPELQLVLHWFKWKRQELVTLAESEEFANIHGEYERAAYLIKKRLELNAPVVGQLSQGLGHLVLPYNLSQGLEELYNLADDITYYAGDKSNDFAWYSKRAGIASIYVSSELFMLQDSSLGFKHTKDFVDEKVNGLRGLGSAYNDVEQWGFFNAISLVNLIKSQLVRG